MLKGGVARGLRRYDRDIRVVSKRELTGVNAWTCAEERGRIEGGAYDIALIVKTGRLEPKQRTGDWNRCRNGG